MAGPIIFYCFIGAAFGFVYLVNLRTDPKYKLLDDKVFLSTICLVLGPFIAPIALPLYLVWKFHDKG